MERSFQRWLYPLGSALHALLIIPLTAPTAAAGAAPRFSPERAGFVVKFNGEVSSYRVNGVFVLPGEELRLEALDRAEKNQYEVRAAAGPVARQATNQWRWQAPIKPGLYPVAITHPRSGDSMTLNVFVMVPYQRLKGGYLNGYRVGAYPTVSLRQRPHYALPRGFVEVTKENQEALVAPHFKLKQFLCKQDGRYPKYVVLKERLLLKLESILEKINEKGYRCTTFHIMSGYRTPYYNRAIRNVQHSRHLWGDAADIFVDENKDGTMDDLNRDGRTDHRDAAALYRIIDLMHDTPFSQGLFTGGLGRYRGTALRGPFVHVDVRGSRARWED